MVKKFFIISTFLWSSLSATMTVMVGPTPTNARLTQQFIDENNCTHNIFIDFNNNYFDQVSCPKNYAYAGPLGLIPFTDLGLYIGRYKTGRNMRRLNTITPASKAFIPTMPMRNMTINHTHIGNSSGHMGHGGGRHR